MSSQSDKPDDPSKSGSKEIISHEEATIPGEDSTFSGRTIGKYEILRRIAQGGTAAIYLGRDTVLKRDVALKVLLEHLETKKQIAERFQKEALLIAQIQHPNILAVYDFIEHQGRYILVVEYVPGYSLEYLFKKIGKIPEDIVIMICIEILQGLKAAHQRGIVHRDIKPANVLVHPDLGVKLSDFGIAKLLDSDDGNLTKAGMYLGTPHFSSPEQIEGNTIDERTDLFSLGLTAYSLATGTHAFKRAGDSTATVWFKITRGKYDAAREQNPDISPQFDAIIKKALEVKAENRYQTADAFISDLSQLLSRRGLLPYHSRLQNFLKDPEKAKSISYGSKAKAVAMISKIAFTVGIFALAAAPIYWFLNRSEEESIAQFEDAAKELQTPEKNDSATEEKLLETSVPEPVDSSAKVPSDEPEKVDEGVKAPVTKKKDIAPKAIAKRNSITAKANALATKAISNGPKNLPYPLTISPSAKIIMMSGHRHPPIRITWDAGSTFALSKNSAYSPLILSGESPARKWDAGDLGPGLFFWKTESKNGSFEILSSETYRKRVEPSKRPLIISTQFADAEAEINPINQVLRLTWPTGPDAKSYKLEIAKDPQFNELIFSGVVYDKSYSIDRSWKPDQTIYWRVSFLDEAKNPFFMDAAKRLRVVVKASASYTDILSPVGSIKASSGSFSVRAIAPSKASISCYLLNQDGSAKSRKALVSDGIHLIGKFESPSPGSWFVCESEDLYFVYPSL